MFVSRAIILAIVAVGSAQAFTVAPVAAPTRSAATLFMAESDTDTPVEEAAAPEEPVAAAAGPTSGMSIPEVRKAIKNLNKENFKSAAAELESFFLNDAGSSFYTKGLKRVKNKATELGEELSADYAKAAKATAKRREKQNAFIQQKVEEAAAAAEEAAAAVAEEAAAAAEAVTPAEEPASE